MTDVTSLPEAMRYRCWDCGAKDTKLCALCDAWYCDAHKKPHDHPEPQSGPARDAWIAAGLPYDAWVRDTEAGRVWAGRRKGVVAANADDIVVTAWTCATCRGHSTIVCDPDVGAIPCPACALAVHGPKDVVVTARPVELGHHETLEAAIEAGRVWAGRRKPEDGVPLRELERSLFSPEFIAEVDRDHAALKAALCSQCGGPFVPQADDADDACPFTVGRRFFSEALQAPCRVLRASNEGVDFVSEGTADTRGADVRTEVPLELAHRHLTAGRWRLLPDALDTVRATTELVAKALEPTVWDRIGALLQKLATQQGGPRHLTGKHVVKISYYEHDGSAMVEVEDRGREVAHSDEHFRKETPDALLDALEVVCKEVGACT